MQPCMWFGRKKPEAFTAPTDIGDDPRRADPRHATESVTCLLGELLDISSSGMRVRCQGKPPFAVGGVSTVKLSFQGGHLHVTVQERWRRRSGWRAYQLGLKFVNTSPNVMAAIDSLVTFGFIAPDAAAREKPKPKNRKKVRVSIDLPDYYAVLRVQPDAEPEQIHTAYRRLARQYHPDANTSPDAQAKFISICQAYKILSDTQQRRSYDLRQAG